LIVLLQVLREQGAEKDILAEERAQNRTLEKITIRFVFRNKYYPDDQIKDRKRRTPSTYGGKKYVREFWCVTLKATDYLKDLG
jgi:hypothetical protein